MAIKGFYKCHTCGGTFDHFKVLHDTRQKDDDDYDDAYVCPLCGTEDDFSWQMTNDIQECDKRETRATEA